DAIHYKVKDEGRYVSKAVYTILGLNAEGQKELLGLYCSESEGSNYWLSVLTDLHNRGVKDILIACVDGLTGFPGAIEAVFPETEIQLCVIHQIRNSVRYVASKDQKVFIRDLKPIYKAVNKAAAEMALDEFEEKWGKKYPKVIESWRNKWHLLSNYFKYPEYVRKPIYTTNAVEAVHRQFRKLTKTKGAFPNENSLMKLLYVGIQQASKKWTMPVTNWGQTIMQLSLHFPGRLDDIMKL
nr:IS256 family transposase [Gammaproteobacteria bacterium]